MKTKKKKKRKGHNLLAMTITTHHQLSISLLHCSSEEYCDCSIRVFRSDCSIRVYRSFKQVFRGSFMGPPGAPFRLGPGAKCPSCPPCGRPWQGEMSYCMQVTYKKLKRDIFARIVQDLQARLALLARILQRKGTFSMQESCLETACKSCTSFFPGLLTPSPAATY